MAPEALRGTGADARSDIWALGILLHEMTTGKRPFNGDTGFQLTGAILHEPPLAAAAAGASCSASHHSALPREGARTTLSTRW